MQISRKKVSYLITQLTRKFVAFLLMSRSVNVKIVDGGKMLLANRTLIHGTLVAASDMLLQVFALSERLRAI